MTTMTTFPARPVDRTRAPGLAVTTKGLGLDHGSTTALDEVTLDLGAGQIHGLLGRNGAGKTTLLSVIASLLPATRGNVHVDGRSPFEDEDLMSRTCLVRDGGDLVGDERLSWNLDFHEMARPSFDRSRAVELCAVFGLDLRAKVDSLSRGQRSAFGAVIGLSARAELTMFDEVQLGMDAPSRDRFAELLIAEVSERPHTVILSSHLISEIEPLLETVTILDRGRVLVSTGADDLRTRAVTIAGRAADVDAVSDRLDVIATRDLGPTRMVTAYGDIDPSVRDEANRRGLEVGVPSLHDLFIHLTEAPS